MAASTYFSQVQQLYIAYFGRPADPIGQAFWANQIDLANGSIASVIAGFSASAESAALFGNKSTIDKVTAIYQNAFGRAPEPAGLAFWVAQLDSGKVSQAQASYTIQQSAGPGDAAAVQNKLTAAIAFTAQIDTTAEITGYQGAAAADVARAYLSGVTSNNATATAAVTSAPTVLAAAVLAGGTTGGSSFVLTAGADILNGTANNDTFTADNTGATKTASAADTINGGAGIDTLRVFLAAGDTGFSTPSLNSVEQILINGGAITAYTAAAGTTDLIIEAPAAMGANYTVAGQTVTLKGATVAGTTTVTSAATATAANVTLNGWGSAALAETVTLAGAALATANLKTTGTASAVTLTAAGTALKTVNLSGEAALTLTTTGALSLNTVNASTATGAVTVDVSAAAAAAAFAFTGGAGNDRLTLADNDLGLLTAGSQLDGGAGIDTLFIKDTVLDGAEYGKLATVKNFEVLGLGGAITLDASQTTFKAFAIANAGANTIANLGASTSVTVLGAGTVSLTAAIGNTATEVALSAAGSAGTTLTTLTATGLTTLGLTSNGTSLNTITTLANADNSTITIKGATDLTITNGLAATGTGSKVDAAAFTGKLTVTGSTLADIIIGGSGADVIAGGRGADTVTGGAGIDTFVFDGAAAANTSGVAFGQADVITDFVVGTDKLQFTGVADVVSAQQVAVQAAVSSLAAGSTAAQVAAAMATASTTNLGVSFATFGGNTFVLYETTGAGTGVAADDVFIQLTGVASGATFANAVIA